MTPRGKADARFTTCACRTYQTDTIVKQVLYTGWNETQEGDRTVRIEPRKVLKKYGLPLTGPLFDNAYGYMSENY